MTRRQWDHLQRINAAVSQRLGEKYVRGAAEHGTDLQDLDALTLVDHAIDEAVDQLAYLFTLRDKMTNGAEPSTKPGPHQIGLPSGREPLVWPTPDSDRGGDS